MVFDGLVLGQVVVSSESNSPPALVTRHVGVPRCSTRVEVYRLCVLHDLLEYLLMQKQATAINADDGQCVKAQCAGTTNGAYFKTGIDSQPPLASLPLLKGLMTKRPRSFLYQQVCPEDPAA